MSNYLKLYLLTRLDALQGIFIFFIVISGIVITVVFVAWVVEWLESYDKEKEKKMAKKTMKIIKPASVVLIISIVILSFIPSKKQAIFIIAGGKTMDFIQQDSSINKIPSKTTLLIYKYLDAQIKNIDKIDKKHKE